MGKLLSIILILAITLKATYTKGSCGSCTFLADTICLTLFVTGGGQRQSPFGFSFLVIF